MCLTKSNTTKFQYENSFWIILEKMLLRNRWWKRKSHHQKNLNCLRLMIHHRLNQHWLTILLQSKYRDFLFKKKLQTKIWFVFFEKINHWTKKKLFFSKEKFSLFKFIEVIEWTFRDWECFIERVDIEKYQFLNKCN
jgi:hypothetical protein